jgi:hypothetical protein
MDQFHQFKNLTQLYYKIKTLRVCLQLTQISGSDYVIWPYFNIEKKMVIMFLKKVITFKSGGYIRTCIQIKKKKKKMFNKENNDYIVQK